MSSLDHLCNVVTSFSKIENVLSNEPWTQDEITLLIQTVESNTYRLADGRSNWTSMKKAFFPNRKANALRNKYLRLTRRKLISTFNIC